MGAFRLETAVTPAGYYPIIESDNRKQAYLSWRSWITPGVVQIEDQAAVQVGEANLGEFTDGGCNIILRVYPA
jgi:hypothetical protein